MNSNSIRCATCGLTNKLYDVVGSFICCSVRDAYETMGRTTPAEAEQTHVYRITFIGRTIGALGICTLQQRKILAFNAEVARLGLYLTHEHIEVLRIEI